MRKSDLDCANRIAEADHPEAADLPPRPSLTFSFAMEDKIKGKEKDSMFENLAFRGRCSSLIRDPPASHPVRLSLTLDEQLIQLHQLP
jgi:hypothetical protein